MAGDEPADAESRWLDFPVGSRLTRDRGDWKICIDWKALLFEVVTKKIAGTTAKDLLYAGILLIADRYCNMIEGRIKRTHEQVIFVYLIGSKQFVL